MRRTRPNWVSCLRKGMQPARRSLYYSLSVCAIFMGLFKATTVEPIQPAWLCLIFGSCLAISVVVLIIKSRPEHLPDIVTDEKNNDGLYGVTFCDEATLQEANALTKPYYKKEYVSDDVAENWRKKNPKGFISIRNNEQDLCAAFGIIAMEKSFWTQFVKGRLIDNELEPDDILDFEQSKKASELYISGVVVRDSEITQGKRRAGVMVWVMIVYLKKMYGTRRQRTIYALAVSETSERMLKRCGFSVKCPGNRRKDGLNLYSLQLDSDGIKQLEERIGDWSKFVRPISFIPPQV